MLSTLLRNVRTLQPYTLNLTASLLPKRSHSSGGNPSPRLQEVGILEKPLEGQLYQTGQCVFNKALAYRGVVIMSWKANVVDSSHTSGLKTVDYYQVLLDQRDVLNDRLIEATPKEPWPRGRFLLAGIDHVCHDELLPYTPSGGFLPIVNVNARRLFKRNENDRARLIPKAALTDWRTQHLPWLTSGQVNMETTREALRVTATCFYTGRHRLVHRWRCSLRVDNISPDDSYLLQGHEWDVFSPSGRRHVVKGVNLPGNRTVLSPEARAVQHTFYLDITAPLALTWGFFIVSKQPHTEMFRCKIPAFPLESVLRSAVVDDLVKNT
ncbi:polymerase delta-interacting protein 2-like [Nilaparvata lugens]|uniref:polymerase delta-interacting protein 2-like n=1 Tax=Nilaparvata lugens TaxID=108931 RepID=UPI00193D4763|nr:polymerase delta-interacting protein 2-like [Nilaparvata lugens]